MKPSASIGSAIIRTRTAMDTGIVSMERTKSVVLDRLLSIARLINTFVSRLGLVNSHVYPLTKPMMERSIALALPTSPFYAERGLTKRIVTIFAATWVPLANASKLTTCVALITIARTEII